MSARLAWLATVALVACMPELDEPGYRIDEARVIAVVADPAEVRPGDTVTLSPVVAGRVTVQLGFRFCRLPRPLAEPRPVDEGCLVDAGIPLEPRGDGAHGVVPRDACSRFGPEPTSSHLRPVDADGTGGFYQPIVVSGLGAPSVFLLRVHCQLPSAPTALARELALRYELNQNPELAALELATRGGTAAELALPAGAASKLRVRWPASSREEYLWLPPGANALVSRREALRLDWFASNATLASSGGVSREDDDATFLTNTLRPSPDAELVELWLVLQDSRGGSAAQHWQLPVQR